MCLAYVSVMQTVFLSLTFSPSIYLFQVITVSRRQRVHCSLLFSQSNRILSASALIVWRDKSERRRKKMWESKTEQGRAREGTEQNIFIKVNAIIQYKMVCAQNMHLYSLSLSLLNFYLIFFHCFVIAWQRVGWRQ